MNKLLTRIAAVLALSVSGIALAANAIPKEPTGSGPNPFSDCGIGAAIFKETGWAAATSNIIWDLGTTAVTSATASPQTCSRQNIKAAMMVRDAYAQIVEDAARGQGEHLAATLALFSCERGHQNEATQAVRADVRNAVSSPGYDGQQALEKAGTLFNIIDRATRLHCAV